MRTDDIGARVQNIGTTIMLRYGLVAILLMIGAMKWTAAEAEAIRPWVSASPFLSWIYGVVSVQAGSQLIGSVEIVTALLIGTRRWFPMAAVAGSILASIMFVTTLSFLVTTPNQTPDAQGFMIKDFFLLGAAMWSAGEALQASTRTSTP